jgi:hypothetical protein
MITRTKKNKIGEGKIKLARQKYKNWQRQIEKGCQAQIPIIRAS